MAGNNSLTLNIVAKVQDRLIGKLESKMKTVISTAKKLETATGKGFDKLKTINVRGIENLNNKIKPLVAGIAGLSVKFSNLKSKIASSFPTEKINNMKTKLTELKAKVSGVGGAFGGMKSKIGAIAGVAGAFIGVGMAIGFASSSVEQYKDSLEAQTKLQANLSTVKAYGGDPKVMQQNLALMQQQQTALQKVGVYDDDLVAAGQAQLSTFQLTGSEINQLMPKMADLVANQKGMNASAEDFYSTSNMIGKAISTGNLSAMKKVGIAVSEAEMAQFKHATQTEKVAMMNKILEQNVGKVNEALAKTDLGRVQQGTNLWNNMKETVGKSVVQVFGALAPALYPLIDVVEKVATSFSGGLVNAINKVKPIIDNIMKSFGNAGGMEKLKGIGESLKGLFTDIATSVGALFKGMDIGKVLTGIVGGVKGVIDGLKASFEFIKPVLDPILFGLGKFVTFISPAIPVIAKIVTIFLVVVGVITTIITVVTTVISVISGIVAIVTFLFSPLGIVISIITAIIFVFSHWKTIAKATMDGIKVGIQAIGTFFVAVWNGLVAVVQYVWNAIVAGIGFVVSYYVAGFNMLVFVATFAWNMILAVIMGVINGIKAYIAGVVFVATFIFNQVKGIITGAFNSAKSTVTSTIEGIKSAIGGIISKVKEIVTAVKNAFNPANWKVPNIKIPFIGKNYTGTKNWRGGLTTVAEKGQEIIKPPSGKPFLAQSEMMLNLPSGTEILNNAETQKELTTQPKSNKLSNSVNTSPTSVSTSTTSTSVSTSTTSTNNKTSANNISISQVFNVYETGKDSIDKLKAEMRKGVEEVINSMFAGNLVAKGEI